MAEPTSSFPLPPRPRDNQPPAKQPGAFKRSRRMAQKAGSLAAQSAKAVAETPSKLMERVNRELYKRNAELAVRNKTLALLRKLDEISLAEVEADDMAQKMALAIAAELGYELISVALVEPEKEHLHWLALASTVPAIEAALELIQDTTVTAPLEAELLSVQVLKTNRTEFVDDISRIFPPAVLAALEQAAQAGERAHLSHSLLYPLKFGGRTLGLLTLSASRDLKEASRYEHEALIGVVGLVALALYKADIYEDLQRTSKQLAAANEQLKDLDKAKSEFLSIASHQLYTPLTALRGYISMLLDGDFGEMSDKQQPILDILNTSAERLITLIKNLLDISRIESGRLELNLAEIDLVKMVDEMVQQLYPNAVAKGLKLVFHHPTKQASLTVVADDQRLRQVLLNFIDNAIKYTQKGRIDIKVERAGDEVSFSVTDTGKGLSEEEITKLFNKFSRVGGASRFHTEGTGLGLYVAKQIVKEHRGEVIVTSSGTGKGSTFGMRMPVAGSAKSLKVSDKTSVVIKAADANGKAAEAPTTTGA